MGHALTRLQRNESRAANMKCLIILTGLLVMQTASEAEPNPHIKSTKPLSGVQQRDTFTLPDGFEIKLFASEPEIQKPMNLAFDARGRLWVSGSLEYPYAVAEGKGRNTIKVLEDTDGDGRADKITTFVDGLNIPMGLYPYKDGVIAYSIPNIYHFRDTNGDGRADRRDILFGPLGSALDTHGMQNAFRRGFDGWLYINHGYANTSTLVGGDGNRITLNSGNTYRIRLDTSRVEQYSWGQVNPFGSCWLDSGNLVTTDCHSKPLTLLMRDGYYSSFGKPHDGLGYAPNLMEHQHGSTGLAGVAYSSGNSFPEPYQHNLYLGNVITNRIHRDTITYNGSSREAVEQSDFITSTDPWFRPVDVRYGPDGALYIADFYNRIIGHYEVPLDHPSRDRSRGRIWRVTYHGPTDHKYEAPRLDQANLQELIQTLGDPNLVCRMLAMDQLTDRIGVNSEVELRRALAKNQPTSLAHVGWTLLRIGRLQEADLRQILKHENPFVVIHGLKILAESQLISPELQKSVVAALAHESSQVRRAAAETAARRTDLPMLGSLLDLASSTADTDPFLQHQLKIAIRNQLRSPANNERLVMKELAPQAQTIIANIALAIPSEQAALMIISHLEAAGEIDHQLIAHTARYIPLDRLNDVVTIVRRSVQDDIRREAGLFDGVAISLQQRGIAELDLVSDWCADLATRLLASEDRDSEWNPVGPSNPWGLEMRTGSDGQARQFVSSLPGGEQETGVLRSRAFVLPERLKFDLCGHRGPPTQAASNENLVRLILANNGNVIRQAYPPRRDNATKIAWDLQDVVGQTARLEIVDGLTTDGFAWVAISQIEPQVLAVPEQRPRNNSELMIKGAQLAQQIKLGSAKTTLLQLAETHQDAAVQAAALDAILTLRGSRRGDYLLPLLSDRGIAPSIRSEIGQTLLSQQPTVELTRRLFRLLPLEQQSQMASSMSNNRTDSELLLQLVEQGIASRQLLQQDTLRQRIVSSGGEEVEARIASLLTGLPPVNEEKQQLLDTQVRSIQLQSGSASTGREAFKKHCASCHQIGGEGELIGPQLDGIGNRGLTRLVEDVLTPHRNVDAAFQSSVLILTDGRVLTGLFRRQEGKTLVFADAEGKEFMVSEDQIEERQRTRNSIMPDNFATSLDAETHRHLFSFLTSLQQE